MRRWLAAGLLLAGCGGGTPAGPPPDTVLRNHMTAGRLALDAGRNEEAARQYGLALARARERDSAKDLAEAMTGRAVALIGAERAAQARDEAAATRAALERRGAPVPATLRLAEATALYAAGDAARARALLDPWPDGEDPAAARRAAFLLGLIAAKARDRGALAAARARVAGATQPDFRGDAAELEAWAALLAGEAEAAERAALEAIAARRAALDYRGVTRGLRLAADAAAAAGAVAREAAYALRAGESAAARGDVAEARRSLARAQRLAREPALRAAVDAALASLPR